MFLPKPCPNVVIPAGIAKTNELSFLSSLVVIFSLFLLEFIAIPPLAYAGDGVYLVFKDGREAILRDGYKQLMAAMRELEKTGKASQVLELNLDGNSFFIDTAQLAVVCREPCRSFEIIKKKG